MIISAFAGVGKTTFANKYSDKVIELESGNFKWLNDEKSNENKRTINPKFPINYLEAIKSANSKYKIVLISQHEIIRKCLDAVRLDYIIVYPNIDTKQEYIDRYNNRGNLSNYVELMSKEWDNWIGALNNVNNHKKIILNHGEYLENYIDFVDGEPVILDNPKSKSDNVVVIDNVENVDNSVDNKLQSVESKDIGISEMLDSNFYIDDVTFRELKIVENKVRAGMLLQAKNRLCRVEKMLDTLNKLEDELFNRFEDDAKNMRLSTLVEATSFISSLIRDSNNMIMSVVGNPKLQNLFIIDNSKTVNMDDNSEVDDLNKRKRIRQAVQIVLENLDKINSGDLTNLKQPNDIVQDNTEDGVENVNKES